MLKRARFRPLGEVLRREKREPVLGTEKRPGRTYPVVWLLHHRLGWHVFIDLSLAVPIRVDSFAVHQKVITITDWVSSLGLATITITDNDQDSTVIVSR